MTELTFKNPTHLHDVFTSAHVKNVVGPDGINFNDFAAATAMLTTVEHKIYGTEDDSDDAVTTADYFVACAGRLESGIVAANVLGPLLVQAVEMVGEGRVQRVDVTERIPDTAGIVAYFNGGNAAADAPVKPVYTLVFKLYLQLSKRDSLAVARRVQRAFEDGLEEGKIDKAASMILFGKRGLVFDQARGFRFDASRQPIMFE